MRARWHLMKMEVGYRKANESELAEFDSATVDVGVMVYPNGEDCSLQRTKKELSDDIFTEYFPIDVPVYVIEYE